MALVASSAAQKAKLVTKGRFRPHEMIRKKLPDGMGLLKQLPTRAKSTSEDDDTADKEYCAVD